MITKFIFHTVSADITFESSLAEILSQNIYFISNIHLNKYQE